MHIASCLQNRANSSITNWVSCNEVIPKSSWPGLAFLAHNKPINADDTHLKPSALLVMKFNHSPKNKCPTNCGSIIHTRSNVTQKGSYA